MTGMDLTKIYRHRFSDDDKAEMQAVWKVLVADFFQKWVKPEDAVLDVGAGLCLFINQIHAQRKVAVDANPAVAGHCGNDVEFINIDNLQNANLGGKFDVVFMSNFLEHLASADDVLSFLSDVNRHLAPEGRLIILQPNFALVGAAYFDFIDHKTILTDKSLVEALRLTGYEPIYVKRRFLPYTSKSRLPKAAWLVRLYLYLPPAQFLFGQQSLIIARRQSDPGPT